MKPLTLSALAILLAGCAAVDRFWDKEIVAVYAPDYLREQEKDYLVETYNYWLGQPKKDRVRALGAPSQCTALDTGGELCEWMHSGSAAQQHVAFTYDSNGIARSWISQGVYGQFTSADAHLKKAKPAGAGRPAPQPERKWTHPSKPEGDYAQDSLLCQNDVQQDPNNQAAMGSRALLQHAVETCLKQRGWVQTAPAPLSP